ILEKAENLGILKSDSIEASVTVEDFMQTAILIRTFYFSRVFFKQCWTLSASLSPQYLFWRENLWM
uniref:Uncharacterized protein n=2 Tax=Anas TaxID=8835 RepID=A0A8B9ZD17_ANAPL